MTVADLLRGDRPWRVRLAVNPRPATWWWLAFVVALLAGAWVLPSGLWWLAFVAGSVWRWRPQVWLTGGGRQPLTSSEMRGWVAHLELTAAEIEHERKVARRG